LWYPTLAARRNGKDGAPGTRRASDRTVVINIPP
jgi:hypothetical protein